MIPVPEKAVRAGARGAYMGIGEPTDDIARRVLTHAYPDLLRHLADKLAGHGHDLAATVLYDWAAQ